MNARDSNVDPQAASQFDTIALGLLIDVACKAKVANFIMLSTALVYDTHLTGHIYEYSVPNNPHLYATSNLEAEGFF